MDIYETLNKLGEVLKDEPISRYNTYKVGGIADYIFLPSSVENLIKALNYLKENKIKFKVIGNGSNLIFSSKTYKGVLIKLDNINNLDIKDNEVYVEAGYKTIKLANKLSREGYTGLEFATGIPGTIGGAVFMNAGAYNSDFKSIIKSVTYLDDNYNIKTLNNKDLEFEYRNSIFKKERKQIILSTTLLLEKDDPKKIIEVVESRKKRRIESQPLDYPSAGSVFRNPEGNYAGKLIEDLGLKGYTIGGAKVSEKHANFIINAGNATGEDIKELIEYIQSKVKENYNIDLILEQELVNF